MQKKSELLLPAGSLEKLKIAILYGADAVYMGTPDLSLRTSSQMSLSDVEEGISYAHRHGKKVYLTLNLFSHNSDLAKLDEYVDIIAKLNPDGVIIADPGVFQFVQKKAPHLELHISTQANICSSLSVKFWQDMGAKLVVLAREVSFSELKEIREQIADIKLEAFIHGAMCMTYSGRCLLSNFMSERGANQGNCSNSCRWDYKLHLKLKDGSLKDLEINDDNRDLFEFFLEEGYREGDLMQIEENERGSYILNSKDLCLMPKLNEILEVGIDSLKVEGRGRSAYYAAIIARAYRHAMDAWYEDKENWSPQTYMQELYKIPNRGYTLAFHDGRLQNYSHNYEDTHYVGQWQWCGQIIEHQDDAMIMLVKNRIEAGDVLEFLSPTQYEGIYLRIYDLIDSEKDNVYDVVNAGQQVKLRIPYEWFHNEDIDDFKTFFPEYTLVRSEIGMSDRQWSRLKLDKTAMRRELEQNSEQAYQKALEKFAEVKEIDDENRIKKTPRVGVIGCCGRGCNGCRVFWHDKAYEKSRQILQTKKQGQRLSKEEAKQYKQELES